MYKNCKYNIQGKFNCKKKIIENFSNNKKKLFEKIYLINMPKHKERLNYMKKLLKKLNLFNLVKIIPAINGNKININDLGDNILSEYGRNKMNGSKKDRLFGADLTKGALGLALTSKKIWEKIIKKNKNILILEDDITIDENIIEKINNIDIENIDFDILYLGSHTKIKENSYEFEKINNNLYKCNRIMHGAFAYIVTPNGAKKLLKIFPLKYQIDTSFFYFLNNILNIYIINPDLIKSEPSGYNKSMFKSSIQDDWEYTEYMNHYKKLKMI